MKHLWLAVAVASLGTAQIVPNGQLPPGPPPPPGQLGPAPATLPKTKTEPPPPSMAPVPEPEQVDGNVITVNVHNVLVPTTVFDPDGHGYVNGLTQNEFSVLDNGKPQKIIAEFTQQPLSVVLVVQANSEIEPMLPKLRNAGTLVHGLVTGTEGDLAVIEFDHRIQVLQNFTSDPDKIDDAMQKIKAGSSSARLIDAVLEADHMLKHRDPRNVRHRVIIVLSRNVDKGSEAHLQETVRQMQFDNVIIYNVDISRFITALLNKPGYPRPQYGGIPPAAQPNIAGGIPRTETTNVEQADGNWLNAVPPLFRSIHDLFKRSPAEAFSYFTAGNVYTFGSEKGLESAITDIGQDLNSQYLLSYVPNDTNESGFHTIKVIVDRPGLKIRSRPGYWWGGGATQ